MQSIGCVLSWVLLSACNGESDVFRAPGVGGDGAAGASVGSAGGTAASGGGSADGGSPATGGTADRNDGGTSAGGSAGSSGARNGGAPSAAGVGGGDSAGTSSGANPGGAGGEAGIPTVTDDAPSVLITHPSDGDVRDPCPSDFAFIATASDSQDGNLSSTIRWTSSIDGDLGEGAMFDSCLAPGTHLITATVVDSDGNTTSAAVSVTITGDGGIEGDPASDDFQRGALGPGWQIAYPSDGGQVLLVEGDLGMGPGAQGFFLVNWVGSEFTADQFCEGRLSLEANPDWLHQVYVRWRESDRARYGFGYNGDVNQPDYGKWYFKYDGVASDQTRMIATSEASDVPGPGDVLRVEVRAFGLRGYFNGELVLEATDTDPSRITDGIPGLAARWASGNGATDTSVPVWESWSGGSL